MKFTAKIVAPDFRNMLAMTTDVLLKGKGWPCDKKTLIYKGG
jgi:hypothetical protein